MAELTTQQPSQPASALNRMVNREEVLQICFWYQGEGFGEVFSSMQVEPFLNCSGAEIEAAFAELVDQDHLQVVTKGYQLTDEGKKLAGKLFAENFSDFQRGGHGECDAGCCDGDDHSQCGDHCDLH